MVFAGLHARAPGIHEAHETYENVVQWGDPLFQNFYRMPAWVDGSSTDGANPGNNKVYMITAVTEGATTEWTIGVHDLKVGDTITTWGITPANHEANTTERNGTVNAVTATTVTTSQNTAAGQAWTSGGSLVKTGPPQVLRPGTIMSHDDNISPKGWVPYVQGDANRGTVDGFLYIEQEMGLPGGGSEGRWRGFVVWGGPLLSSGVIVAGYGQRGLSGHPIGTSVRSDIESTNRYVLDDYFDQIA